MTETRHFLTILREVDSSHVGLFEQPFRHRWFPKPGTRLYTAPGPPPSSRPFPA